MCLISFSASDIQTVLHHIEKKNLSKLLPPANEVWGKVICLQACVCPQGGCMVPGGVHDPGGVHGSGGGGCAWSRRGGAWSLGGGGAWSRGLENPPPPNGYGYCDCERDIIDYFAQICN